MITNGSYVNLSLDDVGNLVMRPTKNALKQKRHFLNMAEKESMLELLQDHLVTWLVWVYPEEVGALTDSIILSDCQFCKRDFDGKIESIDFVWWYPEYQVENPIVELLNGEVIFTRENAV